MISELSRTSARLPSSYCRVACAPAAVLSRVPFESFAPLATAAYAEADGALASTFPSTALSSTVLANDDCAREVTPKKTVAARIKDERMCDR